LGVAIKLTATNLLVSRFSTSSYCDFIAEICLIYPFLVKSSN